LCEEKKRSDEPAAAAPLSAPAPSSPFESDALRSAQALTDVLAAFDLVLFLSECLDIVGIQGRPARLGWRKAKLAGKTVGDLLAPSDRAILRRMLKKLHGQTAHRSKDTLVVCGENGNSMPCRAVLGRWEEGSAAFFLAFVSLELPARLKCSQPAKSVAAARLAA
jgi:hypothetical protein